MPGYGWAELACVGPVPSISHTDFDDRGTACDDEESVPTRCTFSTPFVARLDGEVARLLHDSCLESIAYDNTFRRICFCHLHLIVPALQAARE
jgi:hypothetical protein